MDYDSWLLPEEPQAVREEKREVTCSNDECIAFEEYHEELVEIDYWSDTEARFTWQCESCMVQHEEEFNPNDEVDWDSYYEGRN